MEVTLIRSQYALDELPQTAVIINVIDGVAAQKGDDGWELPGRTGTYRTDDLMSSYPGPWQLLHTTPTIVLNMDGPREPRPAYCRCDFR